MSLNAGKILGINITLDSKETILENIKKYLYQNTEHRTQILKKAIKPFIIVTPNPEQIVLAQRDTHFKDILNQADVALPDGIGISLAAKFLQSQIPNLNDQRTLKRIAGVELMEELVALAAKQGIRIGLIGGRAGLAVKALECLQKKYQGVEGWAQEAPEIILDQLVQSDQFDQFISDIVSKIQETKVQIVFVGLGAPKQEYFIENLKSQTCLPARQVSMTNAGMQPIVLMSVGGSFDMFAGKIQRAPLLVRSIGFEWAWRLMREPWRFRRQLSLVKFMWLVYCKKLASQGDALRSYKVRPRK